jgi:GntR family transcriptional regulator / MocR family aminotransferase
VAVRWTGPGPELLVALDRSSGEPLGMQLQRRLRDAIRDGRLVAGERLPSSRSLAGQLGVSRGLVVDCYEQLCAEGYLITVAGSATQVADRAADPASGARERRQMRPAVPRTSDVNFEYGIPDLASFPMQDWLWAVAEAARTAPARLMGDEEDAGLELLRDVVTAYHRRVRAGAADKDDAVIVGGFRQGLNLVLATLAGQGIDRVGLEDPGPREHDLIAHRAGLTPVPVRVDEHGLDVDQLADSGVRAVVTTPAHQCPTGVVLTPHRRQQLVAWAERVDGVILEDDYDAEFRYDRRPVGSVQGLAPHRVVSFGSVSKTLAPGVRIGWVLTPPRFTAALAWQKHLTSRGVPALDQLTLAHLMSSGRYDRFLRRMREVYAARRRVLTGELAAALPGMRLDGLEAGCHGLLRLPGHLDEDAVVAAARARSVRCYGLRHYRFPTTRENRTTPPGPSASAARPEAGPALVLGFGNLNDSAIRRGVATLADVITTMLRSSAGPATGGTP